MDSKITRVRQKEGDQIEREQMQAQCWICPECHDDRHHKTGDAYCQAMQENDRLRQQLQQAEARVAELEKQAAVTDSLIDNRRSRRWHETHTKEADEAWLLRKQAEALDDFLEWAQNFCSGWAQDDMGRTYWHDKQIEGFANRRRQQADELER